MDAITQIPTPVNEPVWGYAPNSPERASLEKRLAEMSGADPVEFTTVIGGEHKLGGGPEFEVRMPSDHGHVLGKGRQADKKDAQAAIDAAAAAAPAWAAMPYDQRAAVFLRAADMISGPYRDTLNGATMLGQAKTVQQAEIDAVCELIDFLRFNVSFGRQIHEIQPVSSPGVWNQLDYRPLDGFVYAITPFNFTAIAGNLPTSAALMGNTVIWKPSMTQQFAAHYIMEILEKSGLPAGVINLLPGQGEEISKVILNDPGLAGIHFTGSTPTFQKLWTSVGNNIANYRSYPRIVGETGGKDFILAHPSAEAQAVKTALVRGAFEYSGQKCSACSRAYIPQSIWDEIRDGLISDVEALKVGDVRDLANFTSAVIDEASFKKLSGAIKRAKDADDTEIIAGGTVDDSVGWFVRPTVAVSTNPDSEIFSVEYFGPFLGVFVYPDDEFEKIITTIDESSAYALTGAIFATDRAAVQSAQAGLRGAAGNFYVNDKCTGAVVGQQPFGGARASGTNDKSGSMWNLIRWASPRAIKETLVSPIAIDYPHMG